MTTPWTNYQTSVQIASFMNGKWHSWQGEARCGSGRSDWSDHVACSWGGHWLALCPGGRGVYWKGRGVFTHRLSNAAADIASERSCSDRNRTLSVEWSSSRGSVASPQVALHIAGLRSLLVCPPCVWPSPQRPAPRWNSPFPEGRLWRDWGHISPEDWDCRRTELFWCTNTGEFASFTKPRILMRYSLLSLITNGSVTDSWLRGACWTWV